jgi:hypothetical protein
MLLFWVREGPLSGTNGNLVMQLCACPSKLVGGNHGTLGVVVGQEGGDALQLQLWGIKMHHQ